MIKKKIYYFFRYWFWALSRLFVFLYIRPKFNLVREKGADPIPQPPFIMIANHGTFFDPWIAGHYSKYPLSIMMNEDAYYASPFVRWYLQKIGTFPKKKGVSDYKAMKKTLSILHQGFPILIFPEGQTTWDGETQPIFTGIEKIVKRTRVPLIMMNIQGNFLCKPWWAKTCRKGKVLVNSKVISVSRIQQMSEQELLTVIVDYLYNNDIKNEKNKQIAFSGNNLAEGLERFVWICKTCSREDTLVTSSNTVMCTACKSAWSFDSYCTLTPQTDNAAGIGDLYDWADWHKQKVQEKVQYAENASLITQSHRVGLGSVNKNGSFRLQAEGTLQLTKETFSFKAVSRGDHSFTIPTNQVNEYTFQRKDFFVCYANNCSYRFFFNGHSPMKWVYYFRYLNNYQEYEKRGYM